MLHPGLYEQVINQDLTSELAEVPEACKAVAPIDKAEASKVLAQYLDEERKTAKQRLVAGEVRFLFVVDIYNEGVDIPEVNTVLFLRPTESLTIFCSSWAVACV